MVGSERDGLSNSRAGGAAARRCEDGGRRKGVGQRPVLDLAVFTEGYPQQDSGRRVTIGDLGDIHVDMYI